jgi:hypothetical protein
MHSIRLVSIAALGGALMVGGCGKKPDDVALKNASVETVAKTTQNAVKIEPGQWEISFAIDKMEMPGMPAGASEQMKQTQKTSTCITPEQAAKPAGDFFAGKGASNCTFDTFTMADGKMNATMSCKQPNTPGTSKTVMSGSYGATEFSNEVTSTVSGMPGGQTMTMHATSSGHRVGECTGKAG